MNCMVIPCPAVLGLVSTESVACRRVIDAGTGSLQDIRPTDADIVKCRRRYDVFKVRQQFVIGHPVSLLAYAAAFV